jgi:hypothetical protein
LTHVPFFFIVYLFVLILRCFKKHDIQTMIDNCHHKLKETFKFSLKSLAINLSSLQTHKSLVHPLFVTHFPTPTNSALQIPRCMTFLCKVFNVLFWVFTDLCFLLFVDYGLFILKIWRCFLLYFLGAFSNLQFLTHSKGFPFKSQKPTNNEHKIIRIPRRVRFFDVYVGHRLLVSN